MKTPTEKRWRTSDMQMFEIFFYENKQQTNGKNVVETFLLSLARFEAQ